MLLDLVEQWIGALGAIAGLGSLLVIGAPLFFGSLTLYLWGLRSLGEMFGPSSGFGVRLYARHRLVTRGPYSYVRHPMYLGVIGAAIGSLLFYRTWAALALAIMMFGTMVRARREETVLSEELGAEGDEYAAAVPAWLPRLSWKRARGA